MGGNVLWTKSDTYEIVKSLMKAQVKTVNDIDKYDELLSPIKFNSALIEQTAIIKKMIKSGMSINQVACILELDVDTVKILNALDDEYYEEYDYRYINGAKTISFCEDQNMYIDYKELLAKNAGKDLSIFSN